MPTGKVRWYDVDKGFGFLATDDGEDVFVHASALPDGMTSLKQGAKVEFGIVDGKRGKQALSVTVLEQPASVVKAGRKPGAIVNMSSVNDTLAIPTIVSYCMSKGGVSQLTRATSIYLSAHGIRVNAIGPGSIRTDMFAGVVSDPAAMQRVMSRTPLGRPGEPSEVAAVAAFLASDDASYVTGETIYIDGGRMPLNYTVPVKA